jgi:hypothetical protein
MTNFNFKRRNLFSGPHLLGMLLLLAGIFAIVSPAFLKSGSSLERILAVGIGTIIIGLFIVSSYSGTLFDFTQKRFKEYVSIGGYKSGEWTTLPDILKIKVISASHLRSNIPNGISPTLSVKVTDFTLLMYSNSQKPIFLFKYSSRNKAVKEAKRLAKELNADADLQIPEQN